MPLVNPDELSRGAGGDEPKKVKQVRFECYKLQLEAAAAMQPAWRDQLWQARASESDNFIPGFIIQLLPESCQIRLGTGDRTHGQEYVFEPELPQWTPVSGLFRLAGTLKTHDSSDLMTVQGQGPINQVPDGQKIYIQPTTKEPFYEFAVEGQLVDKPHVWLSTSFDNEMALFQLVLEMAEERQMLHDLRISTFKLQTTRWRCLRREWEFNLVQNIWLYGDLHMLRGGLGISNLLAAWDFVWEENERDRRGQIPTWSNIMTQYQYDEKVTQEKNDITQAITRLKQHINDLDARCEQNRKRSVGNKLMTPQHKPALRDITETSALGGLNTSSPPNEIDIKNLIQWQAERHDVWAGPIRPWSNEEEFFSMLDIRNAEEIQNGIAPGRGNLGLLSNFCHVHPGHHAWGKPAEALINYAATVFNDVHQWKTRKSARALLVTLERWYFDQPAEKREELSLSASGWESSSLDITCKWFTAFHPDGKSHDVDVDHRDTL
ncbi:hypothetical protein N7462_006322 [Penicillium macrosclerotiorum]|uniref:uncharacterized protein n=1 Tax=Penicillium macrosclerotiorum TaxID=303699 RepID=UPI0025492F74|nr:uncharacterized protein N7462_006322 [Penicillium macrosclerotiorum]KAJ5683157.1 hypothetical protein N7462_006322 [Penicillium macrosclerotiorum]